MEFNLANVVSDMQDRIEMDIDKFKFNKRNKYITINNCGKLLAVIEISTMIFVVISDGIPTSDKKELLSELFHLLSVKPFTYYIDVLGYKQQIINLDFHSGALIRSYGIAHCSENRLFIGGKPRIDYAGEGILYAQHAYYNKCLFFEFDQLIAALKINQINKSEIVAINVANVTNDAFINVICGSVVSAYKPKVIILQKNDEISVVYDDFYMRMPIFRSGSVIDYVGNYYSLAKTITSNKK